MTGAIPGPILFGYLLDTTCTLWHEECQESGQCWFYNRTDVSLNVMTLGMVVKAAVFVFLCLALFSYAPVSEAKAADEGAAVKARGDYRPITLSVVT